MTASDRAHPAAQTIEKLTEQNAHALGIKINETNEMCFNKMYAGNQAEAAGGQERERN